MNRSTTLKLTFIVALVALLAAAFTAFAQPAPSQPNTSSSTVNSMVTGEAIDGTFSTVTRFENGVTGVLHTADLTPGDVYTVWWVIFNDYENCSEGACNLDDIFVMEDGQVYRDESGQRVVNMEAIENAGVSIQHASGGVSADGTLTVSASLGEGSVPGIIAGPGLLDAEDAEIHYVVRTHGPKVDEVFADQVSLFGGGCEPIDAAPCDDIQFSAHMPPSKN